VCDGYHEFAEIIFRVTLSKVDPKENRLDLFGLLADRWKSYLSPKGGVNRWDR
jgi:hypothetical protein